MFMLVAATKDVDLSTGLGGLAAASSWYLRKSGASSCVIISSEAASTRINSCLIQLGHLFPFLARKGVP